MSKTEKKKVDPFKSFIAGGVAGGVEGVITYPFEFTKTRLQLSSTGTRNPLLVIYQVCKNQGPSSLYVGCPAFVIGNTVKASVRFLGFDSIKRLLADDKGKLSGPRGVLAGLGAGVLESFLAVTPAEAIKTALIDDKRSSEPKYAKAFGSIQVMKDLGLRGIYAGFLPVTLRQASNQAVRLGAYNAIKTKIYDFYNMRHTDTLSSGLTFAIGSLSGIITVYTTMPIDTVKTRMQSLESQKLYKSTLDCFVKIYRKEGLKAFWKGATPRLGRLFFSGGIVFTIYEKMLQIMG